MKNCILGIGFISAFLMGWQSFLYAGPLAVPSRLALHRSLNPALITGTRKTGFAYGENTGGRDLSNTAPNNCNLRGIRKCYPDQADYKLLFSSLGAFFIQGEAMRVYKSHDDIRDSLSIKYRQHTEDHIISGAISVGAITLGLSRRDTHLNIREHSSDIFNTDFVRRLDEDAVSHNAGLLINLGNTLFLSGYAETPVIAKTSISSGSKVERVSTDGFRGGAIGFSFRGSPQLERTNGLDIEIFRLETISIEQDEISLTGLHMELTLLPFVAYFQILNDDNNNYFAGELLYDASTSFATGISIHGSSFIFSIGRDIRYFTGIDGGVVTKLGLQF